MPEPPVKAEVPDFLIKAKTERNPGRDPDEVPHRQVAVRREGPERDRKGNAAEKRFLQGIRTGEAFPGRNAIGTKEDPRTIRVQKGRVKVIR